MARSAHRYYVLFGAYNLAQFFITPIYPLFLVSRGLDVFQINAVLAVYLITIFVFDVPTGALADVAGRRRAFVAGCLLRTAAYLLYTRAQGFSECLVYEFIDAVGSAFVSGALDAWAVDAVRADGEQGALDPLFARAAAIARALMIAGGVVAGYLAEVSLVVPWVAAAAIFAATAALGAAFMHDPAGTHAVPRRSPSFRRTVNAAVRSVRGAPVLLLLCLLSLATAFASIPVHMQWPPYLRALAGTEFRVLGWIVAALNVASLIGSALLPRLLARFQREAVLSVAALWRSVMVALVAASATLVPAVAGIVLQEISFGVTEPVVTAWVNEHVASDERATVLSLRGTFVTLGGALGLVALGLVARGLGVRVAFAVAAALLLLVALGFTRLGRVSRRGRPALATTALGRRAVG